MAETAATVKPRGWRVFAAAVSSRKSASMLAFGFSSGLPFALLVGTLTAWLGEAKVNLATIGVLSWVGLTYAFKFLWSPLVDRTRPPLIGMLGRRKSWIVLCQALMIFGLIGLVITDPTVHIARFALFAFAASIGSATQDVAIDAWRIDVADERTPVELLSSVYQLGFRTASIVGGAGALFMAARMSWPTVYLIMAALMGVMLVISLTAPDTERAAEDKADLLNEPGEIEPRARAIALLVVGASWVWAIVTIVLFMARLLNAPPASAAIVPQEPAWIAGNIWGLHFAISWGSFFGSGYIASTKSLSATDFLRYYGPLIIVATIFLPLAVAAILNWLKVRGRSVQAAADRNRTPMRSVANHLYFALVAPLADLTERMRWGVLLVIALILTYPLCYNIWASFAYPFYLDYMHYSKDEVAFASKVFGIVMSIIGVSLGGFLFVKIGRFPTVLIGAAMPIFGNFIYADLAEGAPHIDMVLHLFRLDLLAQSMGSDIRMARLLLTIFYENISTGLAGAAFVAYVSGIVSKKFPAVQYALLSSLTFLIGSLGKGPAGEMIDKLGYATVFRYVALGGALAIVFVLLEWWRSTVTSRTAEPGHTGEPA